jgi:hypothetical protein
VKIMGKRIPFCLVPSKQSIRLDIAQALELEKAFLNDK